MNELLETVFEHKIQKIRSSDTVGIYRTCHVTNVYHRELFDIQLDSLDLYIEREYYFFKDNYASQLRNGDAIFIDMNYFTDDSIKFSLNHFKKIQKDYYLDNNSGVGTPYHVLCTLKDGQWVVLKEDYDEEVPFEVE